MPNDDNDAATAAAPMQSGIAPATNGSGGAPPNDDAVTLAGPEPRPNPPPGSTDDSESAVWRRLSLHEFLVDFLGGLVPGVLFTAASALAVLPTLLAISMVLEGQGEPLRVRTIAQQALEATSETPSAIWIGLFALNLMLAYVLGTSFYRRDPKIPDIESLKLLLREATRAKRSRGRLLAFQDARKQESSLRAWKAWPVYLAWNRMLRVDQAKLQPNEDSLKNERHFVISAPRYAWLPMPERWIERARNALGRLDARAQRKMSPEERAKEHREQLALERAEIVSELNADDAEIDSQTLETKTRERWLLRRRLGHTLLTNLEARTNFACCTEFECEFPYKHLSTYLDARNHQHLAPYARAWEKQRSKTHPNRLKIRLSYRQPEKYRPVVRNEAHVRLATSTWYMGRSLTKQAVACVVLLASLALAQTVSTQPVVTRPLAWLLTAATPALIVLAIARMSVRSCEAFVHYQRLREAFYLLELAYTAEKKVNILDPPASSSPSI